MHPVETVLGAGPNPRGLGADWGRHASSRCDTTELHGSVTVVGAECWIWARRHESHRVGTMAMIAAAKIPRKANIDNQRVEGRGQT